MAKKKDAGKQFEEDIKASFPTDFFVERYKDDTAGFKGVANPADFRVYKKPFTFLIECKSHKGKSLPLVKIRESQLKGLAKAVEYDGIYGGFLFNYRELEETFYIPVISVQEFMVFETRKSIPVEWCRENGIKIPQRKKRVRYTYDLNSWLERYYAK